MFCLKGQYYRVNGECVRCPQSLYAILIGMGCVMLFVVGFMYWLNKRQISIALVSIGVDYAQVISMFAKTRIHWPKYLKVSAFPCFLCTPLSRHVTAITSPAGAVFNAFCVQSQH
jgi:hypothetical protein